VSALLAARLALGGARARLASRSIDGGDGQVAACLEHLADNALAGADAEAFTAALAPSGGPPTVLFSDSANFGAGVVDAAWNGGRGFAVRAIDLPALFADLTVVDFFDIDIQGAEGAVFDDAASLDALDAHVKYAHVGTHFATSDAVADPAARRGNAGEQRIVAAFEARGWTRRFFFPRTSPDCAPQQLADTPQGPVCFADGAMAWENPRLKGK